MSRVVILCGAHSKRTKKPCGANALKGSVPPRCRHHIGSIAARDRAAVRKELEAWRITDDILDDKVVMLRLMTQAYRRAAYYGWLIEQVHEDGGKDLPDLLGHLIGHVMKAAGSQGDVFASEEAIRGLVVLEGQERDRAFRFAKECRGAGIEESLLRIEEEKASMIVGVIRRVLLAAGVDPTSDLVSRTLDRELRVLDGIEPS